MFIGEIEMVNNDQEAKEERIKKGVEEILTFRGYSLNDVKTEEEFIDFYASKIDEDNEERNLIARYPRKSNVGVKTIRELDEYTRMRRWFTAIIVFFFLSSPVQSKNLEKELLSPPPELVKVLRKREKELQNREAKLKVKEKFLQTLKDDVSFLLNILDEKAQREESKAFGGGALNNRKAMSISNEEINQVYKVISRLPPDEGGQILSNVKPQIVAFLLLHLNSMQAANLLANMEVRHAAKIVEILYSLAPEKAKSIFNLMDSSTKEELRGVKSEK